MALAPALAALLAVYTLYRIIAYIASRRQFDRHVRENGCQPAHDTSGTFPYIDKAVRVLRMGRTGEDLIDDILGGDFKHANTVKFTTIEGSEIIQTLEPANLQAMLATQFKDFETGRFKQFAPVFKKGIFSSDGPFWEHSRALFRPQFSRENINDLESTDQNADVLMDAIGATGTDGWTEEFDLKPLLFNFTLDTATEFLFGESVHSQAAAMEAKKIQTAGLTGNHLESAGELASSLEFKQQLEMIGNYMLRRFKYRRFYWVADGIRFRLAIAKFRKFVGHFVNRALETSRTEKEAGEKYNLLSALANQTQDREELRDQTLSILIAGRDTTASLLSWCFVRLALHPEILVKLREAILAEFQPGAPVDFAKLKSCRYLQHFLNEVLRLHATIPINTRTAVRDTTLPVGGGPDQRSPVAVKKGQHILFSVYLMHRRTDIWGEDASEFKPERWENKRVTAWHYLPFLGGPRICIGQQFALTEASYVLMRLLRQYDGVQP